MSLLSADAEPEGSPEAAGDKGGAHAFSAKAKRKAALAKADTEGTKGSMLDAFVKTPPPKPDSDQEAVPKIATAGQTSAQSAAKADASKVCGHHLVLEPLRMTGSLFRLFKALTLRRFSAGCASSCMQSL